MPSVVLVPDVLRVVAGAAIPAAYDPTVTVGPKFEHQMRIIKFFNDTDADVFISFNAVDDNEIIPPQGFVLLDITTNKKPTDTGFFIAKETIIFPRGASTTGNFYVSAYFARGS